MLLDTSGSMERHVLAKALGTIASYADAKDVPAARLICCDAAAYDLGYLPAADIAQRIALKGRGGTVLQPGVDLLLQADDFPKDGPILIITDGQCDQLRAARACLSAAARPQTTVSDGCAHLCDGLRFKIKQ